MNTVDIIAITIESLLLILIIAYKYLYPDKPLPTPDIRRSNNDK